MDHLTEADPDDLAAARAAFAWGVRRLALLREVLHDHGFSDADALLFMLAWWETGMAAIAVEGEE